MKFEHHVLGVAACGLLLLGCGEEPGAGTPGSRAAAWDAALGEVRAKPEAYAIRCDDGLDPRACLWYGIYLGSEEREGGEGQGDAAAEQLIAHYWQKGCFLGSGEACGRLGDLRLSIQEEAVLPDAAQVEEGVALLTRGCTGSPRSGWACGALGDYYAGRYELGQNLHRGRAGNYYALGCSLGDGQSCGLAASLMLEHTGSQEEIIRSYVRGCELDDGYSCESLGAIYTGHSALGVARNLVRSEAYYAKACALGESSACTGLGQVYARQGRDTRTREAYDMACTQGDAWGCTQLADIHEAAGDDAQARTLHARACDLGATEQCLYLAALYDKAWDAAGAEQFRGKACELGDIPSCTVMGETSLAHGATEQAAAYYAQACDADEASSCNWLGYIYSELLRDAPLALQSFERACELDDAHGCTWLGHVYFQFDKDVRQAWQAYARGCQLGDQLACQQAHRLSSH